MPTENKRIFVGGLADTITEEELVSKFKKFGDVTSVELKTKKDVLGRSPNTFAFINICLTPDSLHKCFTTLGNTKWKGSYLRLEVAKENFLDRLKRERESQHLSSKESGPVESRKQSFGEPSALTKRHHEPPAKSEHNIGNRRQDVKLYPFKGFSFSGRGDFDYLFEMKEGNSDSFVCPRNEKKRTREVSTSEDLQRRNKYRPSDDLMNRMESFSSMWKDDYIPQASEAIEQGSSVIDQDEESIAMDEEDAEDQQAAFQTRVTSYLRFDPTRKDHQKYILSPNKKMKKKSKKVEVEEAEEESVPKDKFYKVVEDLKSRFEGKKNKNTEGSFSLLAALGSHPQTEAPEDEDAVEQVEDNWGSWGEEESSYANHSEYKAKRTSLLIVAGDPRLKEGIAFISEKPDRKEMLAQWKKQRPILKMLCKKKHMDALREDRGRKLLRGTSRGFPGRGRGVRRGKR